MKSRLFSLIVVAAVMAPFGLVVAADTSPITSISELTATNRLTSKTTLETYQKLTAAERTARGATVAKSYLSNLITVRTRALEQLELVYSTGRCKNINTTAKQAITTELSKIKAELVREQTEINAMTSAGNAQAMAQTIIQTNRVFVIVAPATYGACAAQSIISARTRTLNGLVAKLKTGGADTTGLETYLNQANTEATSAYSTFLDALQTRSTNPTAKISSGKEALARSKSNLTAAREWVQKLITGANFNTPTISTTN